MRISAFLAVAVSAASIGACGSLSGPARSPRAAFDPGSITGLWQRQGPAERCVAELAEARRLAGLGRVREAADLLLRLTEEDQDFLEGHRALQDLLHETTSDWWLRRRYEERVQRRPEDADSWYLLARLENDPERQRLLFEEALSRDPLHPYAHLGHAVALERAGDVQGALEQARASARTAPWLHLPWLYMGTATLNHSEPWVAERFFREATQRHSDDPRPWLGLASVAEDMNRPEAASRAALQALRQAPGDSGVLRSAGRVLQRAGVRQHLERALDEADRALPEAGFPQVVEVFRGRCLAALGRPEEAVEAFLSARRLGGWAGDVAGPLRRARFRAGHFRTGTLEALGGLPPGTRAARNLYTARWDRLAAVARDLDEQDPRSLVTLFDALRSVGWLEEARLVLLRAAELAPGDARIDRLLAEEQAFERVLDELGGVVRKDRLARRKGAAPRTLDGYLSELGRISRQHLGRDVSRGALVREYALLGSFCLSVASKGDFLGEFDRRGLVLLVGQRSGAPAELMLGRLVSVRSATEAVVLGERIDYDECWIESEGLPEEIAGLRRGLAGLTMDRMVLIQLDAIRRSPRPAAEGLPFAAREATDAQALRALDSPSDVARRIETELAARGTLEADLLDAVRRHELVHVFDARRMLPLEHHPLTAIAFGLEHGLDGAAMEQTLEGRAAALSMAECREPRAALASLLSFLPAAEGDTAHAAGYHGAVRAMVEIVVANPRAFPRIDRTRNVVQQLDQLTSEEVRRLGRLLAASL